MRKVINLLTGLLFSLYTAYQIYLYFIIATNKEMRILGIAVFLSLSISSFFALIPKVGFRIFRSILLVAGLSLNFIFMLIFNVQDAFNNLDFDVLPSVLDFAILVSSELATLILLVCYLIFRISRKTKHKKKTKRIISIILSSVAIVLFVSCMVMKCILVLEYGIGIELSVNRTLLSRTVYCLAFVGLAVSFMLPNQAHHKSSSDEKNNPALGAVDKDFVMSAHERVIPEKDKTNPAVGVVDKDFVMSAHERVIPEKDRTNPALGVVDRDFVMSAHERVIPEKDRRNHAAGKAKKNSETSAHKKDKGSATGEADKDFII